MRAKLLEWLARYLPLEVAATACALGGGMAVAWLGAGAVAIAYAATWAENTGFYGVALVREIKRRLAGAAASFATVGPAVGPSIRALAVEFGPAELLDSFVLRPACMYALPALIGDLALGLIAGKVIADVAFFGIAIVAYEWRKTRE